MVHEAAHRSVRTRVAVVAHQSMVDRHHLHALCQENFHHLSVGLHARDITTWRREDRPQLGEHLGRLGQRSRGVQIAVLLRQISIAADGRTRKSQIPTDGAHGLAGA